MAKQIDIHQSVDPALVITADRIRRKQILYNVLSNAVNFSPPDGCDASATAEGSHRRISLSDQGTGIPADKLDVIFREFTQLDLGSEESASKGPGSALRSRSGLWSGRAAKFRLSVRSEWGLSSRSLCLSPGLSHPCTWRKHGLLSTASARLCW